MLKRICVFCGSSPGARPEYVEVARELGETLAARSLGLVYGGASVGVMGELARAALAAGGEVTGVIPADLAARDVAFTGLADLRVVGSMHERKALMAELADGFIALPGGLGTIEEFFEALTWSQLGLHRKPCGLLNVGGYFDHLLRFLDHTVEQRFVAAENRAKVLVAERPADLIEQFATYTPPTHDKAAWARGLSRA